MPQVSEHHSELKRKGNAPEEGWVHLLVVRHSISISDLLERCSEEIEVEVGRRHELETSFPKLRHRHLTIVLKGHTESLDLVKARERSPKETSEDLLSLPHLVESQVDHSFLLY